MNRKEWLDLAASYGYDVVEDQYDDLDEDDGAWIWIRSALCRKKLINFEKIKERRENPKNRAPLAMFENRFSNGEFKYVTHGLDGKKDVPCIEDYADDVGAREWPDYVRVTDSSGQVLREGPKPFRNKSERLSYERLTGIRHKER